MDQQEKGPNWSHPMATGLSTGSPAYGDLKPRQPCGIPFLDQAAHLRGATFPINGFMNSRVWEQPQIKLS